VTLLEPSFLRKLEALALRAGRAGQGAARGGRSSRAAGSGIAFASHRAYTPGDDFRFVDFALYARSDRLFVKQFEEERESSVELLLDCSGSMEGKLELAKQLAAALGYLALRQLDRVSVQPFAQRPLARLDGLRGSRRCLTLLRHLDALQASGATDLPRAAKSALARNPRGGLSFVITDGFDRDGLTNGVDLLRHARLAPVVLLLCDPRDAAPSLEGELSLVDRETGEERSIAVDARLLARYRQAFVERRRQLLHGLRERRVPAFELDLSQSVEHAVLSLLRRGGIVS
jgi:uncharacterized protein (DUF58 family)